MLEIDKIEKEIELLRKRWSREIDNRPVIELQGRCMAKALEIVKRRFIKSQDIQKKFGDEEL